MLAASPSRLEHARALVELGGALRRGKERSEARELLRQGVELALLCGATPLAERGNNELAATGARPRKVSPTGLEALTASERRVAQLAAGELSNKEIAQALFVTVKTVEVHLSHVYRKLEIASRRQLGVALARGSGKPAAIGPDRTLGAVWGRLRCEPGRSDGQSSHTTIEQRKERHDNASVRTERAPR